MKPTTGSTRPQPAEDHHDLDDLRARLDGQDTVIAELREEIAELRALVGRGQREAVRRIDELRGAPAPNPGPAPSRRPVLRFGPGPAQAAPSADGGTEAAVAEPAHRGRTEAATAPPDRTDEAGVPRERAAAISGPEYARLVTLIRALIRTVVPSNAVVAVVSRGDETLVDLGRRTGWHFPRCDDGRYAGHHPLDGAAAVAHLQELRRRGARYLVFPATALWWLTYYDDLRRHLEADCRLVVGREDTCLIYALESRETP
jgi:hypothetical protein